MGLLDRRKLRPIVGQLLNFFWGATLRTWLSAFLILVCTTPSLSQSVDVPANIRVAVLRDIASNAASFPADMCKSKPDSIPPTAIKKLDLNGDSIDDYIIQLANIPCGNVGCGNAGCAIQFWVSHRGTHVLGYSNAIQGIERTEKHSGGVAVILASHGSYCNRAGADGCKYRLTWASTKPSLTLLASSRNTANAQSEHSAERVTGKYFDIEYVKDMIVARDACEFGSDTIVDFQPTSVDFHESSCKVHRVEKWPSSKNTFDYYLTCPGKKRSRLIVESNGDRIWVQWDDGSARSKTAGAIYQKCPPSGREHKRAKSNASDPSSNHPSQPQPVEAQKAPSNTTPPTDPQVSAEAETDANQLLAQKRQPSSTPNLAATKFRGAFIGMTRADIETLGMNDFQVKFEKADTKPDPCDNSHDSSCKLAGALGLLTKSPDRVIFVSKAVSKECATLNFDKNGKVERMTFSKCFFGASDLGFDAFAQAIVTNYKIERLSCASDLDNPLAREYARKGLLPANPQTCSGLARTGEKVTVTTGGLMDNDMTVEKPTARPNFN